MTDYLGTTINESPTIVLEAGADMEGAPAKAVVISEGKAALAGAGANAIGITMLSEDEKIRKGSDVTVQVKDIGAWKAGGKISVGDELTPDADGCAVQAASGNFIVAVALTSAAEAGTIIRAQIIKGGYKPAAAASEVNPGGGS